MKVSFKLLAEAKLLKHKKETLDHLYMKDKQEAKQIYFEDLRKLREQYTPLYNSLQEEIDNFWLDVQNETGWSNSHKLNILDSGELVHNNSIESLTGFCREIFEDGGEG